MWKKGGRYTELFFRNPYIHIYTLIVFIPSYFIEQLSQEVLPFPNLAFCLR